MVWYNNDKDKGRCGIIMRQRSKSRSPSMAVAKSWQPGYLVKQTRARFEESHQKQRGNAWTSSRIRSVYRYFHFKIKDTNVEAPPTVSSPLIPAFSEMSLFLKIKLIHFTSLVRNQVSGPFINCSLNNDW